MSVQSYAKAIVGFAAPGVVALGGALTAQSDGGTRITAYEWVSAAIACLVTSGLVFAIPNKPYVTLSAQAQAAPSVEYVPKHAMPTEIHGADSNWGRHDE
jgi:hypothetical protein